MRGIYETFDLGDFEQVCPTLERYVVSLAGYRKNKHAALPQRLRQRLRVMNPRCFEEWGYEV